VRRAGLRYFEPQTAASSFRGASAGRCRARLAMDPVIRPQYLTRYTTRPSNHRTDELLW